jgi:aspartyl-tRNA synthetase
MSYLKSVYRTHTCGELRLQNKDQQVKLSGWVHNKRDHGGVTFIDLRDHYGLTQLVVNPDAPFQKEIAHVSKESVICVEGVVKPRPEGLRNAKLGTGDIEVIVSNYKLLSKAESLPMNVFPEDQTPEETRLKYRFLDLRRSKLHQNIMMRSRIISSIRRRMTDMGFNEFQTPILTSSSPEGARDFLVPSRLYPGEFYALPQSPQQFKQLTMISGFDRYFQIAPCFRDEDGRADRSPGEHYQLDMEMSFVTQEDVFAVAEKLFTELMPEFRPECKVSEAPFIRLGYDEAFLRYGSDKPDLRISGMEIHDVSTTFAKSEFKAFAGKTVRVMPVDGCADKPRSWFDELQDQARFYGGAGLAYVSLQSDGTLKGPIAKFIPAEAQAEIVKKCGGKPGTTFFFAADSDALKAAKLMGNMRNAIAARLDLVEKNAYRFCWIVDFPMFEKNEETGGIDFGHNPFSMPQGGMESLNTKNPLEIKAHQYDLVCNGYELFSGAIRNHLPEVMYKAFEICGYGKEVVDTKFGGMINAFRCGAPPHGGFGCGVDRIIMLLTDETSIREVIAYPMAQNGRDLLMGAPSPVSEKQLREANIMVRKPAKPV